MGKVMLIYPYFLTGKRSDQIFHPLGISMLSSVIKEKGIETVKLDCTFMTMEEVVQAVKKHQPEIIGMYVMTTLTQSAMDILENIKKVNPKGLYITGGPLPSLYPEKFSEKFDFVFRGEGAKSVPQFCKDYLEFNNKLKIEDFFQENNPKKYPGILGYINKNNNDDSDSDSEKFKIDIIEENLSQDELNRLPIPDRDEFEHDKYQQLSFENTGTKKATIMTTYGCPFECDFCSKPVFGKKVRFRDLDSVFEEIKDIKLRGYDSLWIADDLFTLENKYVEEFSKRMKKEGNLMSWSCLTRVDNITPEIAKIMKSAGCQKVYMGIESGSDYVLELMNKKININDVKNSVSIFKKEGIQTGGFFIVGYPGETYETIEKTFEFALSLNMEEISFNVPYPLPGSKLYSRVNVIKNEDWNFENEAKFIYKSEFDQEWIKRKIYETMSRHKLNMI